MACVIVPRFNEQVAAKKLPELYALSDAVFHGDKSLSPEEAIKLNLLIDECQTAVRTGRFQSSTVRPH